MTSLLQGAMQQASDKLPDALMVVDVNGRILCVTENTRGVVGIEANTLLRDISYPYAILFCDEAMNTGRPVEGTEPHTWVHVSANGADTVFRIRVIPIREDERATVGALLYFEDVTHTEQKKALHDESTSEAIHRIDVLLRSIRTALHLLHDGDEGPLSAKQEDLLNAAREDGERLQALLQEMNTAIPKSIRKCDDAVTQKGDA